MSETFHLNLSLLTPGQLRSSWRLPGRDPFAYLDISHFRALVEMAEAAKIDAVFMGDAPALGSIEGQPGASIDPPMLMSHLSAFTERLGFVATSTTTYNDPYNLARRYSALDHVSAGRAGVNFVTTYNPAAAANFGYEAPPEKSERYARAAEFLDVVTRLWSSWDEGALVGDKATGRWGDPAKVHPIDFRGDFFSVRGPLPNPPSPQGRPVIFQAGGSEQGLELAGRYADAVFTVAQTQEKAIAFREDIRRRAAAHGRDPDAVKISLGVVIISAETEEVARAREARLYETIEITTAAAGFARGLGLDPERFGPDDPVHFSDLPEGYVGSAPEGFQISNRALLAHGPQTLRQLVHSSAGGNGHRLLVGSAAQVADDLQAWFEAGAADGFTVMGADTVADFESFTRLVVPELQARGVFHREYAGRTLRENYGLDWPADISRAPVTASFEGALSHG